MIRINDNYQKLQSSYLFKHIGEKVAEFQNEHPRIDVIKLGIGDVTRALPQAVIHAMHAAVDEMGRDESFRGYGPEQGYAFLREAIVTHEYKAFGAEVSEDEVFVSDGAKCDTGNILDILGHQNTVAVPDPVYPVYVDTNVMAGHTGAFSEGRYDGLIYLEATAENNYVPSPPSQAADIIYLCFPNNPTGATATRAQLEQWVTYAREHKALILFDAAYADFIRDPELPRSIFQIDGAREVAIEFQSFSKKAGFTGTRCAFTVIPKELTGYDSVGAEHSIHALWNRRHSTKFNGVSYPVQRGAAAVYSEEGRRQVKELTDYYLGNAQLIREKMNGLGYHCVGGENAPYIWVKSGGDSWALFETLLNSAGVVTTPGTGFGRCGEGYIRISAFNHREKVTEALGRIEKALEY